MMLASSGEAADPANALPNPLAFCSRSAKPDPCAVRGSARTAAKPMIPGRMATPCGCFGRGAWSARFGSDALGFASAELRQRTSSRECTAARQTMDVFAPYKATLRPYGNSSTSTATLRPHDDFFDGLMSETQHPRSIRSFVTRAGRITEAQQRALEELWPVYGMEFQPRPLDLAALFGRDAPCTLEIGFGNGDNLIALASAHAQRNYLGIEVHRAGVGRVLLSARERGLSNLKVLCHDAVEVFGQQLAGECLDEVLILFPDPWPKKRHHKRRLIQGPFVELLAGRLKPAGLLRLATDWQPY